MPYNLDIPGWMTEIELKHIESLAAMVPENGLVLEVGSFRGRSAWAWAKSILPNASIICVDIWDGWCVNDMMKSNMHGVIPEGNPPTVMSYFLTNTADCPNLAYIQGESLHVLPTLPTQSFDVIFLDAVHEDPMFQQEMVFSYILLKPGGILCGHDFNNMWPDVVKNVSEFARRFDLKLETKHQSSIWVIRI